MRNLFCRSQSKLRLKQIDEYPPGVRKKKRKHKKKKVLRLKAKIDHTNPLNSEYFEPEAQGNQAMSREITHMSRSYDKSPINLKSNSFEAID